MELTHIVDKLVSLELSLIAAYECVLRSVPTGGLRSELKSLLRAHREAAQLLSGRIDGALGKRPATGGTMEAAGPGNYAFNLASLRHEESHAIRHYEAALAGEDLNPGLRYLIEAALLPELRERLVSLLSLEASPEAVPAGALALA